MTEKEKCRLGLLYDANYDPEILADRERAKELLYDYNRLRPSEQIRRTELLKKLLGKTGENLIIEPPFACDRSRRELLCECQSGYIGRGKGLYRR